MSISMFPQDELVTSSGAAGGRFTWHGKLIYRSMSTANNNKVGSGFLFRYTGYGARKGHQCRRPRCCPPCVSGWRSFALHSVISCFQNELGTMSIAFRIRKK